nr:jmjC domain-containing protein 4 isoform X1 [Ipomoea batatas]
MGLRIGGRVEKVNGKELSYVEFAEKYMGRNQPVVLTGLMDDWRACRDWVTDGGKPNLQFFSTHFGTSKVQASTVAECGTREFTDQRRIEMTVAEFINCAQLSESTDDCTLSDLSCSEQVSYLFQEYPEYVAYKTPLHFCDDWLNLYLDKYRMHNDPDTYNEGNEISCSDYRFVYIGSKGTWTPLHADVFRSYSWSANVCGRKKWYFLPPSQHHLVYDRNMKNSVYNIFADVNEVKFPGLPFGQKNTFDSPDSGPSTSTSAGGAEAMAESLNTSFGAGSYARRILESMGWKEGEALGSSNKGLIEPLQATRRTGNAGLGWNQSRGKYSL